MIELNRGKGVISDRLRELFSSSSRGWTYRRPESFDKPLKVPKGGKGIKLTGRKKK